MKQVIRDAIDVCLRSACGLRDVQCTVEHPHDAAHGDYASNCALVAVRHSRGDPLALAEKLKAHLDGTIERVDRIEIAGPGFLNFHLARSYFTDSVRRSVDLGERF